VIEAITGASQESTEACEEKAEMAINSIRSELEGKINARMEYAVAVADKQTQALREELNQKVEGERRVQASIDTRTGDFQDDVTTTGTEDRTGEQCLVLRHHSQWKKRAQENGGPWQKFAAFRRRFTRRAVPALLKRHVRKGPRRNRCSGIRGPGKRFHSKIEGRSLKQRQIKGNVARETPEGWTDEKRRRTRPECNSGIRRLSMTSGNGKRGRTEKRCLERMKADREIIRRSLHLEIAKLMIMSFIGLQESGDGTLWKCRPPPKAEEVVP
jgi:hypothetical protein